MMTVTKKRTKRYVPRAVTIPGLLQVAMTRDAHPDLALRLHLGIVNLIEAPTTESCNNVTFGLCSIVGGMSHANKGAPIISRTDAASVAIKSAIMTVEGIVDRHYKAGSIYVTDLEAQTLRAAAGKLDDALANIPITAYNQAGKRLRHSRRGKRDRRQVPRQAAPRGQAAQPGNGAALLRRSG